MISRNSTVKVAKNLGMKHNVSIRVIDEVTGKVVSEYQGHNAATNSMLTGIAHYLTGDGVLNQGEFLSMWVPKYISLGTMGLLNQEEDENGLPAGVGIAPGDEEQRFTDYMSQVPGYGADGYDTHTNNNREYLGLGPTFSNRADKSTTSNCELITDYYPRVPITYREIVPEIQAELPQTIDVIYSAFISTGALSQYREPGKDYLFISEVGLWSRPDWIDSGDNGLLAGYRLCPPDDTNWDMSVESNRQLLKENIIKIGPNQVAQVIWKIQIGALGQLVSSSHGSGGDGKLYWKVW